jgi:hypothetical protein
MKCLILFQDWSDLVIILITLTVLGGPDTDTTSGSDSDEEFDGGAHVTLPENCICQHCRFVNSR